MGSRPNLSIANDSLKSSNESFVGGSWLNCCWSWHGRMLIVSMKHLLSLRRAAEEGASQLPLCRTAWVWQMGSVPPSLLLFDLCCLWLSVHSPSSCCRQGERQKMRRCQLPGSPQTGNLRKSGLGATWIEFLPLGFCFCFFWILWCALMGSRGVPQIHDTGRSHKKRRLGTTNPRSLTNGASYSIHPT